MYSGCDFVNGYNSDNYHAMGIGKYPQNDDNIIRAPFKKMLFPEGVVIKKIDGCGYRNCFALDTNGCMYVWGYKFVYDDYYGES